MGETMGFPATVEEFMEQYKIVDSDHVYTNGAELVPIFRMRQWFEHLDSAIKTNANRIRSMTDEELADELLTAFAAFYEVEWSKGAVLEWLKQEASDD